jgi:hypothetical protein
MPRLFCGPFSPFYDLRPRHKQHFLLYVLAGRLRLQMSFQQDFDKTTVTTLVRVSRTQYPVPPRTYRVRLSRKSV